MGFVDHIELKKGNIVCALEEIESQIDSKHRTRPINTNCLIYILNEYSDKLTTILYNLVKEWNTKMSYIIRKLKTEVQDMNSQHFRRRKETTSGKPYFTNIVNNLEHIRNSFKMRHYCDDKSKESYFRRVPSVLNLRETVRKTLNTNNGRSQELPISTDKNVNVIQFLENDSTVSDNASTELFQTKSKT